MCRKGTSLSLPSGSSSAQQLVQNVGDHATPLDYAMPCVVQGATFRLPSQENDDSWSLTVLSLSDVFSFCLNAIQATLPRKANFVKWRRSDSASCPLCGEYQTLQHCLNRCPKALLDGCYTWRNDSVLDVFTFSYKSTSSQIMVNDCKSIWP